MFISNLKTDDKKYYKCGVIIGNYLIKNGFPLLSKDKNMIVFAKTAKLQRAIKEMPFYLQIIKKAGVIYG